MRSCLNPSSTLAVVEVVLVLLVEGKATPTPRPTPDSTTFDLDYIKNQDKGTGNGFWAIIQNNGISLGVGQYKVYDFGTFWDGIGHPGGSQRSSLLANNYNLTNTFKNRHGNTKLSNFLSRAIFKGTLA